MSRLDTIDPIVLGERIRLARSAAGHTQEAVAEKLGVARTTLIAIERGQRKVRIEELSRLAELLNTSINSLLAESAIALDLTAKFRTTLTDSSDPARSEAVALLNRLTASSIEFERLLGRPLNPYYPPQLHLSSGDIYRQAEDAAISLRNFLGVGLGPIADIVSLLELKMGMRVFVAPLHPKISGLFAFDPQAGACMLLNARHPRQRRYITATHETGHFACDRRSPHVYDEQSETQRSREERFATWFSLAFAMPPTTVRAYFQEISGRENKFSARHLVTLASQFCVSPEAACRWLESLELLAKGTFDSIRERGFSAQGLLKEDIGPEIAPRLALHAVEVFQQGFLSEGQIADRLSLSRVEVRELIERLGGDDEQSKPIVQ